MKHLYYTYIYHTQSYLRYLQPLSSIYPLIPIHLLTFFYTDLPASLLRVYMHAGPKNLTVDTSYDSDERYVMYGGVAH